MFGEIIWKNLMDWLEKSGGLIWKSLMDFLEKFGEIIWDLLRDDLRSLVDKCDDVIWEVWWLRGNWWAHGLHTLSCCQPLDTLAPPVQDHGALEEGEPLSSATNLKSRNDNFSLIQTA